MTAAFTLNSPNRNLPNKYPEVEPKQVENHKFAPPSLEIIDLQLWQVRAADSEAIIRCQTRLKNGNLFVQ